jgi:hypothetical protein
MNALGKSAAAAGVLIAAAVLLLGGIFVALYVQTTSHVMSKSSPDGRHVAKLVRVKGIDVNFILTVDRNRVFWSSDFAPVDADFREQIAWDKNGENVVLEVGGARLFGFNTKENRPLTDAELLSVEYPPFDALGFEGTLPQQNSAE